MFFLFWVYTIIKDKEQENKMENQVKQVEVEIIETDDEQMNKILVLMEVLSNQIGYQCSFVKIKEDKIYFKTQGTIKAIKSSILNQIERKGDLK